MYEVTCVDLTTKKEFVKVFYLEELFNKFINKCKYSKKIVVRGYRKW
ncbi:MAG: hypothetical protein MJ245_00480 [Clostridia bacterium]|nr:hypothetical protein [Clostridia bacterium]